MAGPSKKPPRAAGKGLPPTIQQTATSLEPTSRAGRESKGGAAMNFLVDPEFKSNFKTYASMNNMSMKELLEKMYEEYVRNHG